MIENGRKLGVVKHNEVRVRNEVGKAQAAGPQRNFGKSFMLSSKQ